MTTKYALAVVLLIVGLAVGAGVSALSIPSGKTITSTTTITNVQTTSFTLTNTATVTNVQTTTFTSTIVTNNVTLEGKVVGLQSQLSNLNAALSKDNVEQVLVGYQIQVPSGLVFSQDRQAVYDGWHVLTITSSTSSNTIVTFSFPTGTQSFDVGNSGTAVVYFPAGNWSYQVNDQNYSAMQATFNLWYFY